ncbi:hypothetical protein HMI56_006163, partial [Coelomomyces lativittatus]
MTVVPAKALVLYSDEDDDEVNSSQSQLQTPLPPPCETESPTKLMDTKNGDYQQEESMNEESNEIEMASES